MTKITEEQLTEWESLAKEAMPLPWKLWDGWSYPDSTHSYVARIGPDDPSCLKGIITESDVDLFGLTTDFEYIVAACNNFPALISAYREQQAALDAAREALEAVEWVLQADHYDGGTWLECLWCGVACDPKDVEHMGHKSDCQRQAFLAKLEAQP